MTGTAVPGQCPDAQPAVTAGAEQTRSDAVRRPAAALFQKALQNRQRRPICPVVAKLSGVVILLPWGKRLATPQLLLIDVEIPVGVAGAQFPVGDCRIAVAQPAVWNDCLMDSPGKLIAAAAPEDPLPLGDHLGALRIRQS